MINPKHAYDLVIGLDRSDRKVDLHLIDPATHELRSETVPYTDVIPLLVAAIQELSAKNDALEARLAALEGK